jgi:group I intron endonuclease
MSQSGIYRIVHVESGRAYVGQSTNVVKRWNEHRRNLRHGVHISSHLQRAWTKYGEATFLFEILEECPPSSLTEREQWHMDQHEQLYNLAPAAGSTRGLRYKGHPISADTRAKISAANMGNSGRRGQRSTPEHIAKMSAGLKGNQNCLGRKHSEESKAKIGAGNRGHSPSPEARVLMSAAQKARQSRERAQREVA